MPTDGLVTTRSKDGQAATLARLAASLNAHGLTVFAHIDHAMGASQAGLAAKYPALAPVLAKSVSVAVDGQVYRGNWQQPLRAGAEIYLLPPIQGG